MPSDVPSAEWLAEMIDHCRGAHRRLVATVEGLGDRGVGQPSLLPGWTVGHVLTHLARNADSYVRMLDGAARGEVLEQYGGGHEQRADDIEAGSGRLPAELVADVLAATTRLESAFDRASADTWQRHGLARGTPWPCWSFPRSRWREVEVHHVDLGLGYTVEDWPAAYVALELPGALESLPDRLEEAGARARLLAWLFGRGEQPDLEPAPWQGRDDYYRRSLY